MGGTNILSLTGDKHFYVGYSRGDNEVDSGEEGDVSEPNILVRKASKLTALARLVWGP